MVAEISKRIEDLKSDLLKEADIELIFKKHIVESDNFFFNYYIKKPQLELQIKQAISDSLGVTIEEIFIVGSAQTGYSLSPKKRFNHFDSEFQKTRLKKSKSDLDIAIVSFSLHDRIGKQLYEFTKSYKREWKYNEYYNIHTASQFQVPLNYKHYEYYTRGWFRPDFRPIGFDFCSKGSFENLKQKVQSIVQRKIGLAIYSDWYYFKNYHIENITLLKKQTNTNVL